MPVYEYEQEKKFFSKKTFNEEPKGFVIKKNLHIKYKDPNQLHEIMSLLANAEIYDLVKVDYFSEKMEATKAELANKARALLQEKMKNYKLFLGDKIDNSEKYLVG